MQKSIESYFTKKFVDRRSEQATPRKRKAVEISNDDRSPANESPSVKAKKNKVCKEKEAILHEKPSTSKKNIKLVDVMSMFAGEAARVVKSHIEPVTSIKANDLCPAVKYEHQRTPRKSSKTPRSPHNPLKSPIKMDFENRRNPAKCEKPEKIKSGNEACIKIENIEIEKVKPQLEKLNVSITKESSIKLEVTNESDVETSVLTDEEKSQRKRMAAVLYQKFKNRQSVINPGSKEIPKGKPNCLEGLTFLVTGVLESIEREEAHSIIKELGAKVVTTVGKRLNYLVVGEEAGPKKLADAEQFGIPCLNVDEFFDLIRERSNIKTIGLSRKYQSPHKTPVNSKQNEIQFAKTEMKQEEKDKSVFKNKKLGSENELINSKNKQTEQNDIAWTEKYKPTCVKQIIGQQGTTSNCYKLMNWLSKWHVNQTGTKKLQKPNPWAKNDDGSYFKASLLSGPPGVGKTTTVTLVCKELGFDIVEFNASDTRSKRLLKEEVSELLSNKSLYGYFCGDMQTVSKKHVLVMDEVDGMAGNEDRGGIQELISLIKSSHVPIICMCNDRNHQKMRSLVNYCYDLRFNKPRLEQIKGFVKSICFKENMKLSSERIDELILATNNDIRQTINHLFLLGAGNNVELKVETAKTVEKDLKMGPWEVVRKVFSAEDHKNMTLANKSDLFFNDYSMSPLFVQQNYLIVTPIAPKSEVPKRVALTADVLSIGDLVDRRIRSNSAWALLPVQAVFSSILPGEYMEGHITSQINFPAWLGKYSKTNRKSRLAQEIHNHTRLRTSGSRLSVRLDYAPFLLSSIVRPLKENGFEGVNKSLNVLQEYRLLREDVDSLIELSTWPGKKCMMDLVDGRVKATLTRSYNKEILPYSYSVVSAAKKKTTEITDANGFLEMEYDTIAIESEEEKDTLKNDNLIKEKKKAVSSSKTNASASTIPTEKSASPSRKNQKKKKRATESNQ